VASCPLGLAPSSRQAVGVSHSLHRPRSKDARLQRRLLVSGSGEIARGLQGGRPRGKLEGHSLRLDAPQDLPAEQFAKTIRRNREGSPPARVIMKRDAAQLLPGLTKRIRDLGGRRCARCPKEQGISKRNHPSGSFRPEGICGREEYLLVWSSAPVNFKPSGSQMARGARGRFPRAAGASRSPSAGQAPLDSVHASRSCGACGDAGRTLWGPGVRSPKCSWWVDATVYAQSRDRGGGASKRQGDSK
jgi:hypothetical protein